MRLGERAGRHLHRGAAVLERFTGPRLEHGVDALVHELAAVGPILAVCRVLLGPVADARDHALERDVTRQRELQKSIVDLGKKLETLSRARGPLELKRASAHVFYRLLNRLGEIDIPEDVGDFRLMSRRA